MEGLNNVAAVGSKMLVILNDNEMSISRNVGGLAEHLGHLRTNPKVRKVPEQVQEHGRLHPPDRTFSGVYGPQSEAYDKVASDIQDVL